MRERREIISAQADRKIAGLLNCASVRTSCSDLLKWCSGCARYLPVIILAPADGEVVCLLNCASMRTSSSDVLEWRGGCTRYLAIKISTPAGGKIVSLPNCTSVRTIVIKNGGGEVEGASKRGNSQREKITLRAA